MRRQVIFVLTILAASAGSVWAIRPTKQATSIHSLSTRGIVTSPPDARGHMGSAAHLTGKDDKKTASIGNTSEAWQQFVAQTGGGWSVRWNPVP